VPVINVDGPQIADLDKKRKLVNDMAEVAAGVYGLPKEIMIVLIRENRPDCVGVGGELLVDRRKKDN
jgi:4-oxalocrotonate tautomerase